MTIDDLEFNDECGELTASVLFHTSKLRWRIEDLTVQYFNGDVVRWRVDGTLFL